MSDKNVYREQQKLSLAGLIVELPNFLAVTASAILTGSLVMWMDFVDSLGNLVDRGFLTVLSKKLGRNLKYEYNYGIGKLEAISSLLCEFVVILGLVTISIFSVIEIIEPNRPSDLLVYAVLLKAINVSIGVWFFVKQRRLSKSGSRITKSEYELVLKNLVFDVLAFLSLLLCYALRDFRFVWYLTPVLCIALSVYFFSGSIKRISSAISELTDKTLPEDKQLLILKTLSSCDDGYAKFIAANTRYNGGKVMIDLQITFDDSSTYADIREFLHKISASIERDIPDSVVAINISDHAEL